MAMSSLQGYNPQYYHFDAEDEEDKELREKVSWWEGRGGIILLANQSSWL